jgi:predicted nucleotidyltransferase
MEKMIKIIEPFFLQPNKEFHIRQVARMLKMNHMTVRNYLNDFVKQGYLLKRSGNIYSSYVANEGGGFKNLKLFYNLEKIRLSGLIEGMNDFFDYPAIILFGSYLKAEDIEKSDVDICVISDIEKGFDSTSYEKAIKRQVSIHKFSEKGWKELRNTNPELLNNILNGLTISGSVEL